MKKLLSLTLLICLILSSSVLFIGCDSNNTDTSIFIGRDFILDKVEGGSGERTYLYFVDGDTAHFSSDVGNDVAYSKRGDKITFESVHFMAKTYGKLYARIFETPDEYKNHSSNYQYMFLGFYSDSKCTNQIAHTYPEDTVVDKWNVIGEYSPKEFEQVEHDAPNFMPDMHETPAQLSGIDSKALSLFKNIKTLKLNEDLTCSAVLKDNTTLTGKYAQFGNGDIYFNFGENYRLGHQYIQMKAYKDEKPSTTPGYYGGEEPSTYDPRYSNLTPPPYFEFGNMCLYWEDQDSNFIIR